MKAILYFDEGSKILADVLTPPQRKERETQREYENRFVNDFNNSQPHALHKVVRVKIMRN